MSKIPKVSQLRRRDLSPSKGSMLPVLWGLLLHLRLQRRRAELPNFAAGPRLRGSPRSHGAPAPAGRDPQQRARCHTASGHGTPPPTAAPALLLAGTHSPLRPEVGACSGACVSPRAAGGGAGAGKGRGRPGRPEVAGRPKRGLGAPSGGRREQRPGRSASEPRRARGSHFAGWTGAAPDRHRDARGRLQEMAARAGAHGPDATAHHPGALPRRCARAGLAPGP